MDRHTRGVGTDRCACRPDWPCLSQSFVVGDDRRRDRCSRIEVRVVEISTLPVTGPLGPESLTLRGQRPRPAHAALESTGEPPGRRLRTRQGHLQLQGHTRDKRPATKLAPLSFPGYCNATALPRVIKQLTFPVFHQFQAGGPTQRDTLAGGGPVTTSARGRLGERGASRTAYPSLKTNVGSQPVAPPSLTSDGPNSSGLPSM
jgi:hypothetical protein